MSWREECEDASSRGLSFLPSEGDTRGSVEHGWESSKKLEPRRITGPRSNRGISVVRGLVAFQPVFWFGKWGRLKMTEDSLVK